MESQNTSTVTYIVLGLDLTFAKSAQQILTGLQAENPSLSYRIFPGGGGNKDKLLEFLDKNVIHSIMVEEEFIDSSPAQWVKTFRETIKGTKSKDCPLLFIANKSTPEKSKELVRAGFSDVIIKPVDTSLFIQKLALANPAVKMTADKQLFTMDSKKEINLGFTFNTTSISEFGMTIQTDKVIEVGTVLSIYTSFMETPLAAQVRDVKKISEGNYQTFLLFIGVTPAESQFLRKWMKLEYAHAKAAS